MVDRIDIDFEWNEFYSRILEKILLQRWIVFNKSDLGRVKYEKRKTPSKDVRKTIDSDMTPDKRVDRDEEDAILPD